MSELDLEQRAAVLHDGGPLVVLAGPGSGKTRVISERIQRLIAGGAAPSSILCLTFTRRAAKEMQERLEARRSAGHGAHPWTSTFHSIALRILRAEAGALETLPQRFSIYDSAAQARVIRKALEAAGLEVRLHPVPLVMSRLETARLAAPGTRIPLGPYGAVFDAYHAALRSAGALDFHGLLVEAARLLRDRPDIRERWSARFRHVLVDEFQDTNGPQLELLERLVESSRGVTVVVDPDQSIYGWRGATPNVMARFLASRPDATTIKLERNYRSTGRILQAADALIAHQQKLPKRLVPTRRAGEPLLSVCLEDDYREARAIGKIIQNLKEDGHRLMDTAILVRAHSQLRAIESLLARWKIPFHAVGAPEFIERHEIQDLTAYLRLIDNPRDADAFWRAIRAPRRGVGPVSAKRLQAIVDEANADVPWHQQTTLVAAVQSRRVTSGFQGRTREGLESFAALWETLVPLSTLPAGEALRRILEALEPLGWIDSLPSGEGRGDRRSTIEEFLTAADDFDARYPDDGISGFLSDLALVRDAESDSEASRSSARDAVQLMTLHAAKGKEFRTVFIAGLEEELLPHLRSLEDEDYEANLDDSGGGAQESEALEEERRLLFVGLTRARDQVFLTRARARVRHGMSRPSRTSRFLHELPHELVEVLDPEHLDALAIKKEAPSDALGQAGFRPGERVRHKHFGEGTVLGFMGRSLDARVLVNFDEHGVRELYLQHTSLRRLS